MASPLGATEVHDLRSDLVGDTYRILLGHCGPDPRTALVVTDGNGLFGLAVDTIRLMQIPALVPSLLVVGIGYPGADGVIDTIEHRTRDLTPTSVGATGRGGGADVFLAFVDRELRPWLAQRFPEAAADLTYAGHSLGGLLGAHALLTAPGVFERLIVSSPSLWWDQRVIVDIEERTAADDRRGEVVFGIGSLETDEGRRREAARLPEGHPAKPPEAHLDMVDDLRHFVARLRTRTHPGLRLHHVEIPDEFHATVFGTVLSRALRHLTWPD